MLIKLLQTIEDWGNGLLSEGKIVAADTKIATRWVAQGKAEALFPGATPEPVAEVMEEIRVRDVTGALDRRSTRR